MSVSFLFFVIPSFLQHHLHLNLGRSLPCGVSRELPGWKRNSLRTQLAGDGFVGCGCENWPGVCVFNLFFYLPSVRDWFGAMKYTSSF